MKKIYILFTVLFVNYFASGQCSNTVFSSDGGNNVLSINKCLMSGPLSQTGTTIEYDINFSTLGNVGNIDITDVLDSNLVYVSSLQPSFLGAPSVNTITNTVTWSGSPPVSASGFGYNIRLTVMFKPMETCNGTIAPNSISIKGTNIPNVTTNPIDVEAVAIDDWSITKTATRQGKTYVPGETVEFKIVYNGGGTIGRHQLTNVTIQDILPGTIVSLRTGDCFSQLNNNTLPLLPSGGSCYIYVEYPAAAFPDGSCPTNTIKLTGTNPCGEVITVTDTETICFDDDYVYVPPTPAPPGIETYKRAFIDNPVPGCKGYYSMYLKNTGGYDLPDLELIDVFPTGITVNTIELTNYSNNVYEYSVGGSPWYGPISAVNYTIPTTGSPIPPYSQIKIRPIAGGVIKKGTQIDVKAFFTVNSGVNVGDIVSNTVKVTSISKNLGDQKTDTFEIEEYQPKLIVSKSICNNSIANYEPNDELVYRIEIENSGSDAFIGGTLTDVLDNRLDFLGNSNVKVYKSNNSGTPPCSNNGVLDPSVTDLTASSTINFNTTSNTLNVNLPTINADCQSNETIWVEFRVKIKPGVAKGQIPNTATVFNNLISQPSNTVYISVVELYTLRIGKLISIDGGTTYTYGPVMVSAGIPIKYKIEIENVGNSPIQNINLIDILPHSGDVNISSGNMPRGSSTGGILLSPVNAPPGFQVNYSNNSCPDTSPEFGSINCSGSTPANWSSTFNSGAKSIKINSNSYILAPLSLLTFEFDVEVPPNAITGDMMCNSANAIGKQLNGIDTQVFSSGTVCLEIIAPDNISCCKSDLNFTNKQGYDYLGENYTRVHNIIEISGAPNLPLIPISEIRIAMSDIDITYDYEDCAKCIDDPKLWGSMEGKTQYLGSGMADTQLFLEPNIGSGPLPENEAFRELIWSKWSSSAGRVLQLNDALEFYTYLPPRSKIPCCATAIEVCYTISWKDVNCNVCEKTICKTVPLEPLKKKQFELISQKEGCCNVNITMPNSGEYDRFLWSNGSTSSSINVAANGVYTVDAWKNSVKYSSTITVNNIMSGNFPRLSFAPQATPDQGNNLVIRDYTKARNAPFSYNATKYTLWVFSRWDSDKENGAFRKIIGTANCETGFKNGEIQWDGRDDNGNKVQSGEYNFVLRLENCNKKCVSERGTCNETFSYESEVCVEGWVPLFPPLPRPRVWSICKERQWTIKTQRIGVVDLQW